MLKKRWNTDEIYDTINRVNEALASAKQQHHITNGFLDIVSRDFSSDYSWIQLFDLGDRSLRLINSRGLTDDMKKELEFEYKDNNLAYQTAGLCHNINVPDLPASDLWNIPSFLEEGVRSIVSVPIVTYRTEGLLGMACVIKEAYSEDTVKLLATLAGLLGTSLIHARLFELQLARERQLAYQAQLEMTLSSELGKPVKTRPAETGKSIREITEECGDSIGPKKETIWQAVCGGETVRGALQPIGKYDVENGSNDNAGLNAKWTTDHMLKMKNFSLSHSRNNG